MERAYGFACQKQPQRFRGDPPPPSRRIDPVGHLPVALDGETGDHPDDVPVMLAREVGDGRVGTYATVMLVESRAVCWVRPRERCHGDGGVVALPAIELVQIGVVQRPERDTHAARVRGAADAKMMLTMEEVLPMLGLYEHAGRLPTAPPRPVRRLVRARSRVVRSTGRARG